MSSDKFSYLCALMKYIIILAALLMATVCGAKTPQPKKVKEQVKVLGQKPKREFRGAWIQCVNNQWTGIGRERMQKTLTMQLDELKRCGINAIMFQVRAEADALYESKMEPWSRYLTAEQGRAPQPYWDPLAWMVEECHRRGMECHAWINPYRAKTKGTMALSAEHPYFKNPERFFHYDGLMLFDPGQPENRDYICRVAMDIVERYDVDGLHIDDYFYPYPANGLPIPDDASYEKYGNGMSRDDWRRDNVNKFIKQLNESVKSVKPWCKFGVSPFGIYRNKRNDPMGSETKGLQNYDDLYADVLEWVRQGWVDYNIPQIYWQIGHPTADYETLIRWWSENAGGRHLYIGQDVERTVKYNDLRNAGEHQMRAKYDLQRNLPGVEGSCQWYAKAVVDNPDNYATMLKEDYHKYPALAPQMPWIDNKAPKKVRRMAIIGTKDGPTLFWTAPKAKTPMDKAVWYAVYRFRKGEKRNLDNPANLVTVTRNTFYNLPDDALGHVYVVTALDHMQNESKGVKMKL